MQAKKVHADGKSAADANSIGSPLIGSIVVWNVP